MNKDLSHYRSKQNAKILISLTALGFLFFISYGFLNLTDPERSISIIEFSLACVNVLVLASFRTWPEKYIEVYAYILVNTLFSYLSYVLWIDGLEKGSHIWFTVVPITSYLLLGLTWGMRFSLFYFFLAVTILIIRETVKPLGANLEYLIDCATPYMWVWLLAEVYERTSQKNRLELINLATKDQLTGLNNRRSFYDFFKDNKQGLKGLIIFDLDSFKAINDKYGHTGGDAVLKYVAQQLNSVSDEKIQAYRLGGEEFAILLDGYTTAQTAELANQVISLISQGHADYDGQHIKVTASAGVSQSNENFSLDELVRYADERLYRAKDNGRNQVVSD